MINLKATNLDGTQKEFADILKKLGYKSYGHGQWNYFDTNSRRGVWAFMHDNEITFTTYAGENGADIQKRVDSANIMAAMFNGRIYDPYRGEYRPPAVTKSEKIKIMEWRLLK